ncbi:hypothetical protein [Nonomuraea sp. KM90]|uniref:hypothetical protein n=1 Tax=Nonomuraea sp. KM90 TaxID=3457428 RepID=UPI003FCECC7C
MALLDATARARVAAQWMRENVTSCSFNKTDLAAAVAAADQWVEDNTVSYNQALPLPFRTSATTDQKAAILAYVLWRRIGRLRARED